MRRRVLVTGHTGFKGAWLCLWLQLLGAEVSGLARGGEPGGEEADGRSAEDRSLYRMARVGEHMQELSADVRDGAAVAEALERAQPEIVFHLAAQPLVRRSLRDPALTFDVNVMGVVGVLEAVRQAGSPMQAVVMVGSDKCYENTGEPDQRFVEGDPLGGADPYSSSKACAELIVSAYRRSFFAAEGAPRLASARAGNVIGGGDWGQDRLMPDAVRAVEEGTTLEIRNPQSVRPWQHVLNPLAGYLALAQGLCEGAAVDRAWNFGPRVNDVHTVNWIVERLRELWGGELRWELDEREHPPESPHVALDSGAAERELGWCPRWELEDALALVVEWHRAERAGRDMRAVSLEQVERFT